LIELGNEGYLQMLNPPQMLRIKHLQQILKISRSSIYYKLNPKSPYFDPTFPRPIKLGKSTTAWSTQSIQTWLNEKESNQH